MKRNIVTQLFKKRNPITDQNRQNRIPDFVRKSEPDTLATKNATTHKPYVSKFLSQSLINEFGQIA